MSSESILDTTISSEFDAPAKSTGAPTKNGTWPKDELIKLSECVGEGFSSDSLFTFSTELSKVNWEEIGQIMNKPPADCEEMTLELVKGVPKVKNLMQLMDCCKAALSQNKMKKKKLTAFQIYYHKYKNSIRDRANEEKKASLMMGQEMWRNESPEIRKEIQNEFEKNKAAAGAFGDASHIKTPFDIFSEKVRSNTVENEKVSISKLKSEYSQLSDNKKLKYTKKAIKYLRNNTESMTEEELLPIIKKFRNADLQSYLRHIESPDPPPNNIVGYVLKFQPDLLILPKDTPPMKRLKEITEGMKQIPVDVVEKCKSSWKQMKTEFIMKYEKWSANCGYLDGVIYKKIYEKELRRFCPTIVKLPKSKPKKQSATSLLISNLKTKIQPNIECSWPGEPTSLFKPHELYAKKNGMTINEARKAFSKLLEEEKENYKLKSENKKQRTKEKYFEFALGLEKHDRKLYIGFNRIRLIRKFGEDIFAHKYSDKKYPAFIKKEQSNLTTESTKKYSNENNDEIHNTWISEENEKLQNSTPTKKKEALFISENEKLQSRTPSKKKEALLISENENLQSRTPSKKKKALLISENEKLLNGTPSKKKGVSLFSENENLLNGSPSKKKKSKKPKKETVLEDDDFEMDEINW